MRLPLVLLTLLLAADLAAQSSTKITVFAETGRGFRREKLDDGSFAPIRYALAWDKSFELTSDANIQGQDFAERISTTLVANLEANGFILADDSEDAEQLLVVRAGTTTLPSWADTGTNTVNFPLGRPSLEDSRVWSSNARILGYTRGFDHARLLDATIVGRTLRQDLTEDMLDPRHYIVILAYPFGTDYGDKKIPWLWRAHVNVEADGPPFIDRLDAMLSVASRYLGRDSSRIIRQFKTEVEIGEATVVEDEP